MYISTEAPTLAHATPINVVIKANGPLAERKVEHGDESFKFYRYIVLYLRGCCLFAAKSFRGKATCLKECGSTNRPSADKWGLPAGLDPFFFLIR